ncbi:MAG: cellulase family glycosylhydrolase [Verrucomicrobia bacterium]|nr:cellulase family glycosylhydrolase [Verrucomicrobiota bacterium]
MQHRLLNSIFLAFLIPCLFAAPVERWSEQNALAWQEKSGWLVGPNYTPSNAVNQLEMWQAATWSPELIDRELGWAAHLGFNSARVFLHDLAWKQDPEGFLGRVDRFLAICAKHKIRPMLVFFDSCWNPEPKAGPQPAPTPGVILSGWVQSPGRDILADPLKFADLEAYVKAVIGRFKDDDRVAVWDLWNEPNNVNRSAPSIARIELPDKERVIVGYLPQVFAWARSAGPTQPLTAGIWTGEMKIADKINGTNKLLIELSDVISYHYYSTAENHTEIIAALKTFGRPVLCTEYMARTLGSTFQNNLPVFKREKVAAYNWGFVDGKTQTKFAWGTWKQAAQGEPELWFHDILHPDGTPYKTEEADFLRSQLIGR